MSHRFYFFQDHLRDFYTHDNDTHARAVKTSWFPNKGSSGVFENWVAPKLGGRSGLYKMGDSDIL